MEENWSGLPQGETELTVESEAYLELAKEDISKCKYEDARWYLETAVKSANPQAEYLLGYLHACALGCDRDIEKALLWYLRAAEHGYAPAQTAAASIYIDGEDVPQNYAEAYRLLSLAVQKEYTEAEFRLGLMYSEGLHAETNPEKAVYWMEKAAQKGYDAAIVCLADTIAFGIRINEEWAKKRADHGEASPLIHVALRYIDGSDAPQDSEKGVSLLTELADRGIGTAQVAFGDRLITGKGIPKDTNKALRYLSLAAEAGCADLVSGLGVALYKGDEKYTDPDMAVQCLELAARAGDVNALVELGNLYLDGAGNIPPDQGKAFGYFMQAAEQDNPRGLELAGYCLYEGKGTPQNRAEALRWYEKAAEMNLYNSYYMMGMIYGYDKTLYDYEKAVSCFEKSAALGQSDALIRLGKIYLNGLGCIQPNKEKAFQCFFKAAEADNALGWEWTAYCYDYGVGVGKDIGNALKWFHKSAEKGMCYSQYMLGMIYGYEVVPPDGAKAAAWFQKAAEQGHSDAQLKLGCFYQRGCGVKRDDQKAFQLFEQAAAQGHATAMHNLGDAYENGYGVKKDEKLAFAWYMKSAKLNDKSGMFAAGRSLYYGIGTQRDIERGYRLIEKAAEAGLREAINWRP